MSSPGAAVSEDEFREILERVRRFLDRAQRAAVELIDNVNDVIGWLPGALADRVVAVLNRFNDLLSQFYREVGEFVTEPGWPPGLFSARDEWVSKVGARASELVSTATLDETRSDDYWQGVAADAYRNTLPRQKEALTAIKAVTDDIADALTNIGWAIYTAWAALAVAVATFVAELLTEAGAAATGVGAPPAAAAASGSAVKVVTLVGAIIGGLVYYLTTLSGECNNLNQRLGENNAFPSGRWPRSTTNLSDASLNDGDSTDWHIR